MEAIVINRLYVCDDMMEGSRDDPSFSPSSSS